MNQTSLTTAIKVHKGNFPRVVIVGRTNVGKSFLFNRLIGKRKSIVESEHGTTRDFVSAMITWDKSTFLLVDTGGFAFSDSHLYQAEINVTIEKAIYEADLILFICDGQAGIHPNDELFAHKLRKLKKKVILVLNKLDSINSFYLGDEFFKFGFPELFKISAMHGTGIQQLLDGIERMIPRSPHELSQISEFSICIVGEPNVGKSTYFNALLGESRAIVSERPGTTRDTLDELIEFQNNKIIIRDTAGIRSNKSLETSSDFFSMHRSKEAIRASDVVIFMFDALNGLGKRSKQIIRYVIDQKKCCVLTINKWDLVKSIEQGKYTVELFKKMPYLRSFSVAFMAAIHKKNYLKPLEMAVKAYQNYKAMIKTNDLNRFLQKIKSDDRIKGNSKLMYITQIGSKPPHFLLFAKRPEQLKYAEIQFIKNQIQTHFELNGTPIELTIRETEK